MAFPKPFHILDVFAEQRYAGNQLAVILDAGDLSTDEMQQIALEMNYSETTFVLSPLLRDGGYDVRIFTPRTEVPFAGHPTLGTAYVIWDRFLRRGTDQVALNLRVGQIPVTVTAQGTGAPVLWMRQKPPQMGAMCPPELVARAVGLEPADLDDHFPAQEVSTGLPFVIAPLRRLDALRRSQPDLNGFQALVDQGFAGAVLLFCPETYDPANRLSVRVYAVEYGVTEDPATGSANGCLAAYLVAHRYFGEDAIDIRVEQGIDMGRPSALYLRARAGAPAIEVHVGGRVIPVAEGALL
ncbi:MAG: PhzF family phenazine biosynthesis protein [Anaerolineae bacterium]